MSSVECGLLELRVTMNGLGRHDKLKLPLILLIPFQSAYSSVVACYWEKFFIGVTEGVEWVTSSRLGQSVTSYLALFACMIKSSFKDSDESESAL
ncbi:unnamed protein product [Angiostrongylus costaricensis]|uniref:Ovule protein n=1 Tax=Angiostrongylus costaricensis TaxID=334426 RepID=A0A0R3PYK1_ANGCS|nr:unnamed protein product [Angiostrongylus costaricensis]